MSHNIFLLLISEKDISEKNISENISEEEIFWEFIVRRTFQSSKSYIFGEESYHKDFSEKVKSEEDISEKDISDE